MSRIYIAGKITGNDNWKSDFLEAEKYLRERFPDAVIVNPLFIGSDQKSWKDNMVECIRMLITCDTIYLLRDWCMSKGARIEANIANGLGFEIMTQREME